MTPHSPLLQLARIVAKDMARGGNSRGLQDIGNALASHLDSAREVLELLFVEARKKRPKPGLVTAFLFMLQQALEETRWRIENQSSESTGLIDNVRALVAEAALKDQLAPELVLMLAQCFAAAKLDIGEDIRRVLGSSVNRLPVGHEIANESGDFEAHLGKLARDLDNDSFLLHAKLAETFTGFPKEQRIELIATLVFSGVSSLREAAMGWLLDPDPSIAIAVANLLTQAAGKGLVSGVTTNRLINMRNWVDEDRRPAVDVAIRAMRQLGATATMPSVQIGRIVASSCDGAGAQSFFVLTRQKRKQSAACLLVKHGFGIRDAWVARGMSNQEVEALLGQIEFGVGGWNASLDAVQMALAHGLAINTKTREPIPFALLQFIEATGLPAVNPIYLQPEQLVGRLCEEIPENKKDKTAISRAVAASKHWSNAFAWVNSWFDDNDAVLEAVRSAKTIKARTEAVLLGTVSEHRKRWAELLAWNALAARDDGDSTEWVDLALVARELLGNRPIADIPLAVTIARNCVNATVDRL